MKAIRSAVNPNNTADAKSSSSVTPALPQPPLKRGSPRRVSPLGSCARLSGRGWSLITFLQCELLWRLSYKLRGRTRTLSPRPLGFLQTGGLSAISDATKRDLLTSPGVAVASSSFWHIVERKAGALHGLTVLIYKMFWVILSLCSSLKSLGVTLRSI
jgi:hypothetical protein